MVYNNNYLESSIDDLIHGTSAEINGDYVHIDVDFNNPSQSSLVYVLRDYCGDDVADMVEETIKVASEIVSKNSKYENPYEEEVNRLNDEIQDIQYEMSGINSLARECVDILTSGERFTKQQRQKVINMLKEISDTIDEYI